MYLSEVKSRAHFASFQARMAECGAPAIPIILWLALMSGAHAEIIVRPNPEQMFGGPAMEGPGSIDACSEGMLVAAFRNEFIYRIDLRKEKPEYLRIAGDSTSLLKRGLYGTMVKCLDSNTIYLRDTWKLYRIRVDEMAIDTLGPVERSIVYSVVNDTLKNHYIVAGQRIYKVEDTLREIAKLPGGLWNMAICDSSEFMGVSQELLYHVRGGKLDSIASPRGHDWFGCLWIRDRYLVLDRGSPGQAYFYHPITKELKPIDTDPGFLEPASIHTRFEGKDIVVTNRSAFLVNDTGVFRIAVRLEGAASPIVDATFSATSPKFKDAYMLTGGRIGKIVSVETVPVGLKPFRRIPISAKPGKWRYRVLAGYRIDGVILPAGD